MNLKAEGIFVSYGPIKAVRGVTLEVEKGEIVALLGPNGAGKTSLISAVVGLVPLVAGRVTLDGEDVTKVGTEAIVRRGVAVTPEGRRVFADLTVAENLRLGAASRRDKRAVEEDFESYLGMFPVLRQRYRQRAQLLSGGEQQQLAIARSLMSRPRILMLDEPSLGLAPRLVDQIFELLHTLRGNGLTMLVIEQNAHEALELADRAYVMSTGTLSWSGPARDLLQSDEVMTMYLGGT